MTRPNSPPSPRIFPPATTPPPIVGGCFGSPHVCYILDDENPMRFCSLCAATSMPGPGVRGSGQLCSMG